MELLVKRIYRGPKYTIGRLYVNKKYFCDTIEDADRGLVQGMSKIEIAKRKVKGQTCIPYGTYIVTMNVVSPKYSDFIKYPYASFVQGKMPRILNVTGFDGILIHPGTTQLDTDGCLVVGENKTKGKVLNSVVTWKKLCTALLEASKKREIITITYVKE